MADPKDLASVLWGNVSGALPENYATPRSDLLARMLMGAGKTAMIPGQVLNSQEPMTSDQMAGPATDLASMVTLGAGAIPAESSLNMGMSTRSGFKALEDARFQAEQQYIKDNLPPPTSHLPPVDYIKHYTQGMSPEEVLGSDALWAKARDQGNFSKAYSNLGSQVLGRALTPEELSRAMVSAAQYGIR